MVAWASSRLRRVQRLSAPGEDLGSVKLDTVGIRGIDVFRQPVEFLRDPVRLRFEHRHPAEHETPLIGVGRRAGIVEVQKVHGGFQGGNRGATRMRPGEPTGSTDRRGSPPNRSSMLATGKAVVKGADPFRRPRRMVSAQRRELPAITWGHPRRTARHCVGPPCSGRSASSNRFHARCSLRLEQPERDRDRDVRARSSRRRAPPAAVACERPWPPPCRQDEPAGSVIAVSRFSTQRVLIEMRGKSKRHEPMTSEDYQPVSAAG